MALVATSHRAVRPAYAGQQRSNRHSSVCCAAATDVKVDTAEILKALKAAAKPNTVPPREVLKAIVALEKERRKPSGDDWLQAIQSPKARWLLVYTADSKAVTAASKGEQGGSGMYFPVTGCQKFDASDSSFENGVFLGPVASLTFKGPFVMEKKMLYFDVVTMSIGLGGWRGSFNLKKQTNLKDATQQEKSKLPFFVYAYADKDIIVARGRSGGVALWKNIEGDSQRQAEAGVLQVFG